MVFFFFQAEDGIRDLTVTGVQTCALPICDGRRARALPVGAPHARDGGPRRAVSAPPHRRRRCEAPQHAGRDPAFGPAIHCGNGAGRLRGSHEGRHLPASPPDPRHLHAGPRRLPRLPRRQRGSGHTADEDPRDNRSPRRRCSRAELRGRRGRLPRETTAVVNAQDRGRPPRLGGPFGVTRDTAFTIDPERQRRNPMRLTTFSLVRSRATVVVAMLLILALPAVAVAGLLGGLLGVVGGVVGGGVGVLAPSVTGPGPFVLRFEPTPNLYAAPNGTQPAIRPNYASATMQIGVSNGRTDLQFSVRKLRPRTIYTIWTVFYPLAWPIVFPTGSIRPAFDSSFPQGPSGPYPEGAVLRPTASRSR